MSSMKASKTRLLWVIPCFMGASPKALANFLCLAIHTASQLADRYHIDVYVPERESVDNAMNKAAQLMLTEGHDVMIVCDDDCFPDQTAIKQLVAHYEAGLGYVAGLGYMRGAPYTTTIGRYFPEKYCAVVNKVTGQLELAGFEWVDDVTDEPDLIPADFCGVPIAMIARKVFEKIPSPWFNLTHEGARVTHDVYFAIKCKEAGFQVYVDKRIDCGHMADAPIVTKFNRAFARNALAAAKASMPTFVKTEQPA
jgi:hypothetical protein